MNSISFESPNIGVISFCLVNRLTLTQLKCLKSAASLFTNQKSIVPLSGLSNEILFSLVA